MFKKPWIPLSRVSDKSFFYNFRFSHKWIEPDGFDTGIQVYCRIADKKVPFIIKNKNCVKWYLCGPTVYDVAHIGHASTYVRFDILNRILKNFFDIHPITALGVTDIDDKIIRKAHYENVDFRAWAKKHELEFFDKLTKLNILPPSFVLRVSEHIPEIIEFVNEIIKKGKGYAVSDGSVYFDKESSKTDWKLNPTSEKFSSPLKEGQRSDVDFALWKGAKEGEPSWKSPWGEGRPGWHIECSAMASKIFGSNIDIHGGGIDLVFPHHENEETQSCCYHNCEQWVNYWLHTGSLMVQDDKMSKSLKNFVSIEAILKEYTADEFRMYCFLSSYRKALHYSSDSMEFARSSCDLITRFIGICNSYVKGSWTKGIIEEATLLQGLNEVSSEIKKHLQDDFDTGKCFLTLIDFIQNVNSNLNKDSDLCGSRSPAAVAAVAQFLENIFKKFGFQLKDVGLEVSGNTEKTEFILNQTVQYRQEVRALALATTDKQLKKDLLKASDTLRSELETVGIGIKDTKNSSMWSIVGTKKKAEESVG